MPDDVEIASAIKVHFDGQFPKTCPNCARRYASLRDYILTTRSIGAAHSYDAEIKDWEPQEPLGGFSMNNCSCGSTMALTTEGMALSSVHRALLWIKRETEKQQTTAPVVLERIRNKVRKMALSD